MTHEHELLKKAASEIRILRNQNHSMAERLDMFDKMMLLFTTEPQRQGMGMSPDVCWEIDKCIEKAEKQEPQNIDERIS